MSRYEWGTEIKIQALVWHCQGFKEDEEGNEFVNGRNVQTHMGTDTEQTEDSKK